MADTFVPVEPTAYVAQRNLAGAKELPDAPADFENAQRGLLAAPPYRALPSLDGEEAVWHFRAFDPPPGDGAPAAVAPAVRRQGRLALASGLFRVAEGLYQVRGYDLANLTVVTGPDALLVIDPLGSYETARAALALYRSATGDPRPVRAVVHTQSGIDHFGGVRGLFARSRTGLPAGPPADLAVHAPEGFLADAVLRQVTEGARHARLVDYAYGTRLGIGAHGLVGSDLGRTVSTGRPDFLAPTDTVGGPLCAATPAARWPDRAGIGHREGLYAVEAAGVPLVLRPAGGHACPAELNLYLPAQRAVYLAGPGLLGAPGPARAELLDATAAAFGPAAEIGLGAYGAPVWGAAQVSAWLAAHRAAADALPDAGPAAPLLATPGYLDTPSRTVREVWGRLTGTCLGTARPAATARAELAEPDAAQRALEAAQRAYEGTGSGGVPDYARAVLLLDPVVSACAAPSAVAAPVRRRAQALQSAALTQLGYLSGHGRLRNALLTAARDVLAPHGTAAGRFPGTVHDLEACADPLAL
ncbi:MBL fold metallo-hydrolase [Kitasatospora sp. NPDC018619]|uniref:MBL fold metallo-hydrolase n=1 Tax=unclassified Kitasatospora TaxID=2633591 RepID=UPI0037B435FD